MTSMSPARALSTGPTTALMSTSEYLTATSGATKEVRELDGSKLMQRLMRVLPKLEAARDARGH